MKNLDPGTGNRRPEGQIIRCVLIIIPDILQLDVQDFLQILRLGNAVGSVRNIRRAASANVLSHRYVVHVVNADVNLFGDRVRHAVVGRDGDSDPIDTLVVQFSRGVARPRVRVADVHVVGPRVAALARRGQPERCGIAEYAALDGNLGHVIGVGSIIRVYHCRDGHRIEREGVVAQAVVFVRNRERGYLALARVFRVVEFVRGPEPRLLVVVVGA